MPELNWVNRNQAEQTAESVPYHLLKFEQAYGDETMARDNLIIQGDNLQALKALLPLYGGQVKCIFIDPPYNTQSAFEHYDDKLEHAQWLSMMYPRLQLLKDLLHDTGSIWITLDDNESHYLKVMCDEIFGRRNFMGNIIWNHSVQAKGYAGKFSIHHNHILVYRKSDSFLLKNLGRTEEHNVNYSNPDDDPKGRWRSGDVRNALVRPNLMYNIITPNGNIIEHPVKGWRFSKETFERELAEGKIIFSEDETRIIRKIYLCDQDGRVPESLWFADEAGTTRDASSELKNLFEDEIFETPKPEKLIERILSISTSENDLVLDSFLGSGTTAAVAHKMTRRYIGIEMGEHSKTHVIPRLIKVMEGEQGGISTAEERLEILDENLKELNWDAHEVKIFNKVLNKLGKETDLLQGFDNDALKALKLSTKTKKIKSETIWQGGGGFSFYTLGSPVFDEHGFLNPDVKFADLASYVWWLDNKTAYPTSQAPTTPLLGVHNGVAYYLLYNGILGDRRPNGGNVLTMPVLRYLEETFPHPLGNDGKRVIFGEASRINQNRLDTLNIEFKQIPYALYGTQSK